MSVKFNFLIVKTLDGDIFGAFIDHVISKTVKSYIGSSESFLFVFTPETRTQYPSSRVNEQYCIGGVDYLQIGGGGDGAAIYLNDTLQEGQTNASETFANEKLTSNGDSFFSVACVEVILI